MEKELREYYAIELSFEELEKDEDYDYYETLKELEDHLDMNGYDYFLTTMPTLREIMVLLINKEQAGWIDEILEDRNIGYRYID